MKTAKPSTPERLFRACADPTRLRILNLLAEGEVCVCDLVTVLDVPQPKVSRHLAYLRAAGLVSGRKDGLWRHYRLVPPGNALQESLHATLACCAELPRMIKDRKELGRVRCCCD